MSSQPLVSSIIIFYNAEKFFQESIESVFAQTYDNWELLLVDDGSTDGSTAIAQQYTQQYPEKVRYLEHEGHQNQGMSATRNLGIRNARGKYIAFLDADDVWLPFKLEQQVSIMEAQPAAMVYGRTQYWYSWTGDPEDMQRDYVSSVGVEPNTLVKPPVLLTSCVLVPEAQAVTPPPSDILLRRDVVERLGGFQESFKGIYQMFEDQAFFTKLYLQESVFVADECWEKYRMHPDSFCAIATKSGHYHFIRQFFLNWVEEYFSKQGIEDVNLWQALRQELFPYRHPFLHNLIQATQHQRKYMKELLKRIGRKTLFASVYDRLRAQLQGRSYTPPPGHLSFGDLRRLTPISPDWGYDRGDPIDRFYVEQFLADHRTDIRGRVLEIEDDNYTRRFGGSRVTYSDVLHVKEGNPYATLIGDLTCTEQFPPNTFDCILLTQTIQVIYDVKAVVQTLYHALKPGGIVLATVPGITQVSHYSPEQTTDGWTHDTDNWSDYWCWSFTTLSIQRLFEEKFPAANVRVQSYGNVLSAISLLQGVAVEELQPKELEYCDPNYQVIIAVRAVKPEETL